MKRDNYIREKRIHQVGSGRRPLAFVESCTRLFVERLESRWLLDGASDSLFDHELIQHDQCMVDCEPSQIVDVDARDNSSSDSQQLDVVLQTGTETSDKLDRASECLLESQQTSDADVDEYFAELGNCDQTESNRLSNSNSLASLPWGGIGQDSSSRPHRPEVGEDVLSGGGGYDHLYPPSDIDSNPGDIGVNNANDDINKIDEIPLPDPIQIPSRASAVSAATSALASGRSNSSGGGDLLDGNARYFSNQSAQPLRWSLLTESSPNPTRSPSATMLPNSLAHTEEDSAAKSTVRVELESGSEPWGTHSKPLSLSGESLEFPKGSRGVVTKSGVWTGNTRPLHRNVSEEVRTKVVRKDRSQSGENDVEQQDRREALSTNFVPVLGERQGERLLLESPLVANLDQAVNADGSVSGSVAEVVTGRSEQTTNRTSLASRSYSTIAVVSIGAVPLFQLMFERQRATSATKPVHYSTAKAFA